MKKIYWFEERVLFLWWRTEVLKILGSMWFKPVSLVAEIALCSVSAFSNRCGANKRNSCCNKKLNQFMKYFWVFYSNCFPKLKLLAWAVDLWLNINTDHNVNRHWRFILYINKNDFLLSSQYFLFYIRTRYYGLCIRYSLYMLSVIFKNYIK